MVLALGVLLVVLFLVMSAVTVLGVRSFLARESHNEAHLRDPRTPTIAYAIPNGIDPAVIKAALSTAGFTSMVDQVGDAECLRIECDPAGRERVRSVIEGVHLSDYAGSELKLGHAVFQDER